MIFSDCTGRKLSIGTLKGCFASEILMYLSGWRHEVDRLSSLAGSMISAIKDVIPAHSSSMSAKCVAKLACLNNSKYWNQLNASKATRVKMKQATYIDRWGTTGQAEVSSSGRSYAKGIGSPDSALGSDASFESAREHFAS